MRPFPMAVRIVAAGAFLGWMVVAGRYGFHRDELYFIEGGHHPDWAQPDNPILVPLLAAGWHDLVAGNLVLFRVLPALAGVGTILIAAATAAQLGRSPRAQTATALMTALSSFPLAVGHLFSISTFDLLLTSAVLLLLVRAVRLETAGSWLALGVVSGIALEVKLLPAVVLGCCLLGLLLVGPRAVLRRPGPWLAAAIALVLAAPNLLWQTSAGWPMLDVARNISAGGSASSADRVLLVPLMLLLIGPLLFPVFLIGLVSTFRSAELRPHRWVTIAFLIMLALVLLAGGKPYYVGGFFPIGLALGSGPLVRWLERSRRRVVAAIAALAVYAVPTAMLALPLAPVGSTAFRVATSVNPDLAETVGWNILIDNVMRVVADTPPDSRDGLIILTRNYGQAGALSRARRLGLGTATDTGSASAIRVPPVYSGHNAYSSWGPPPDSANTAVVVGNFSNDQLAAWFARCTTPVTNLSPPGVDNEENGTMIRICQQPRQSWAQFWPQVTRFG